MKKQEDKTTRLILEISNYVHKYGEFPRRGTLSIDGIDMGKAITRARTGELTLTKEQIAILERLDDFLSRTEKNIQELEKFYSEHASKWGRRPQKKGGKGYTLQKPFIKKMGHYQNVVIRQ